MKKEILNKRFGGIYERYDIPKNNEITDNNYNLKYEGYIPRRIININNHYTNLPIYPAYGDALGSIMQGVDEWRQELVNDGVWKTYFDRITDSILV